MFSTAVLGLLASGCGQSPALEVTSPSAISLTAESGLKSEDEIGGFDFAAGIDGSLHLVWSETTGLYGGRRRHSRILYRRGDGNPLRWGPPIVVADGRIGKPQVVASQNGVHVIAGARLHHWILPANGGPADDQGDLLGSDAAIADTFDATAVGDAIVVLFLTADRRSPVQNVYSLRWTSTGEDAQVVAPLAPQASVNPQPRLLRGKGEQLLAVWASNSLGKRWDESTGSEAVSSMGQVHASWSADGGRSWRPYSAVNAKPFGNIAAVAVAGQLDAPIAVYGATKLLASREQNSTWGPSIALSEHRVDQLAGLSISATQCGESVAVAWVDERNRGTDRRWWKPLGGWPWSDSPDWINNDLFVLTGKSSAAAFKGVAVQPRRLTPPESLTTGVAIAQREGELLVLRAGRARVRKAPGDANAPPEIQQSRIPCD